MGYQSFNINLQAKTISDTFSAVATDAPTIGGTVARTINGQTFSFVVDGYKYNENTGLYSIRGSYDIHKLLSNDLSAGSFSTAASASDIFSTICSDISKTANANFDGWTPTGLLVKSGTGWASYETYGSALQKVFGWTDIIPTTLVNVFERSGTIYALQRGKETATNDITGYCDNVIKDYSLMNLLYNANHTYYLNGEVIDTNTDGDTSATSAETLISGQFTDNNSQLTLNYTSGLLRTESFNSTDGNTTYTTTYTYGSSYYPPTNLLQKATTKKDTLTPEIPDPITESMLPYDVVNEKDTTDTLTNTVAINGRDLIESDETITIISKGYTITDTSGTHGTRADTTETHTNKTMYSEIGQGQWLATTYRDGDLTGSQIIDNNPGCKASPYAVKTTSTLRSYRGGQIIAPRVEFKGKFAGNTSIPVSDTSTLSRIVTAINNLHGKTQETVTLDYYGPLLVDFLKTVTYKNNVYYLDGNNITVTPTKTCQSLTLLRWY